jgi:integrase
MSTSGRKRGGKVGTGLGPRTIKLTLNALSLVFDMGVMERKIPMNPVRLVKRPKLIKPEHVIWSDAEEARFFATAAEDRLSAVVDVFALGLRPEELCGLRWVDVDLTGLTIAAGRHVRTWVEGVGAVEKSAKTDAGVRTLPLDTERGNVLKAWRKVQAAEKLAAGQAYEDGRYVLCDELGRPFEVPKLRRYMHRLMKSAKVRRVTPYEAMRHAAGSRLARAGVPGHEIAAWLGHTNASFTYDNYVHARPEDLASARDALAR